MSRSIKDLVNTPFKKAMFVIQLLSYVLIVGSPLFGAGLGHLLHSTTAQTGAIVLAVFIVGEVLFYGSLFFLGKELLQIIKVKVYQWFGKQPGNK